ncbi:MAG TPA: sulfite oxidase [Candidatus Saccharimonadales bacterium]|nr:sulfite oxidase [Candidatus Saccharimonadales bacterium]
MRPSSVSRRDMIKASVATAALAFTQYPMSLFGGPGAEEGVLIPFLDPQPSVKRQTRWGELTNWHTKSEDLYVVTHYNVPTLKAENHTLEVSGMVRKPRKLTLEEIKKRKRKTVTATLECGGNGMAPGFMGAIGNMKWTGTPLSDLLDECSPLKRAVEVVFFGADEKVEKIRGKEYPQNMARSLHINDAMRNDVLLCYEMNGEPLTKEHGFPLRLIVPGWFGISWTKWLTRIELLDHRYMSKYMAEEYVTLKGEERSDKTVWRLTSVSLMNVKSVIGRAIKLKDGTVRLTGAAWGDGTPMKTVEVRIDDGPWQPAKIDRSPKDRYAWRFFSFDWKNPTPGEHRIVSCATDEDGRTQPEPEPNAEDRRKWKKTNWDWNEQWPWHIRIEA